MAGPQRPSVVSTQTSASSLQAEIHEKPQSHQESVQQLPNSEISPTNSLEAKLSARDAVNLPSHNPSQLTNNQQHLKRSIRILKLVARLIALVLAIATGAQETVTLHTYLTTHSTIRSGRGPWALETSLWPTLMLLIISFLTIIFSFLTILAYLRYGVKAANKAHQTGFVFEMVVEAGHVLVWIIVAVLYRVGKTGHDLWGWACSPFAQQIQPNFEGVVDFESVCQRGVSLFCFRFLFCFGGVRGSTR